MVDDTHTSKSSHVGWSLSGDKMIIVIRTLVPEMPLAYIQFGNNFDGFRDPLLLLVSVHKQFFTHLLHTVLFFLLVCI